MHNSKGYHIRVNNRSSRIVSSK